MLRARNMIMVGAILLPLSVIVSDYIYNLFIEFISIPGVEVKNSFFNEDVRIFIVFMGALFLTISSLVIFTNFRSRFDSEYNRFDEMASLERKFSSDISSLSRKAREQADKTIQSEVDNITKNIDKVFEEKISSEISERFDDDLIKVISKSLYRKTNSQFMKDNVNAIISDIFSRSRIRIQENAENSQSNSSSFGVYAILFSLTGVFVAIIRLILMFYKGDLLSSSHDTGILITENVAFVSLILLCEVLALILLRYRSKSLEQLRYYSNEATNLEMKEAAFHLNMYQGSKQELIAFASELMNTERNFILDKNQRTIEIAQNVAEGDIASKLADKLTNAVGVKSQ